MRVFLFLNFIFLHLAIQAQINYGKNRFTTMSEGVEREYFVHVPQVYDGAKAVPMVFMLHGTSGDGEVFYNAHGWRELSETENFIAVFPSSLRYKIIDQDGPKTTTKWNTPPDANFTLAPGEVGKDDIKFLRKVIDEVSANYKIDSKRIYLNGFSNGGQMAAKCAIEMSDVLAAVAQNANSFFIDTMYTPKRKLPVLYQVGDRDYGPGNEGPSVPMSLFDTLISTPNIPYQDGKHYRTAHSHQKYFELGSAHTIEGDSNIALVATFDPLPNTNGYEFKFIMIKNLGHSYPNGNNHIFDSPKQHWEWMKKYTLGGEIPNTDYKLTIENGYGSGRFEAGDTVHIWAVTPPSTKTFESWIGDQATNFDEKTNWHTTIVMPPRDITISAKFSNLPSNLEYSQNLINGPYSKKELYTYFPPKDKVKGVAWLFQGSGGQGKYWVTKTEGNELLDLLVATDYAVITMDAEEISQNKDLDNSGNLGFQYTFDTLNNPDMVNLKFFKNYFIDQGKFSVETPQITIGFSNGGAFSEIVAAAFNWAGSLSFNTPGSEAISKNSSVPHFQNNSYNDDGPSVGTEGNVNAEKSFMQYQARDIFSEWILQLPQPLHKERFTRIDGVTLELSESIFNYIKQSGLLDENNYFKIDPGLVQDDFDANPNKYPLLKALPEYVLMEIFIQCKVVYTKHMIRSDYNGSALKFIKQISNFTTGTKNEQITSGSEKLFYPNPANEFVQLQKSSNYQIYDINGRLIKKGIAEIIDVLQLKNGLYFLKLENTSRQLIIVH